MKEDIQRTIIAKMVNRNLWGGKHTQLLHIIKSMPLHYRSTKQGKKEIMESVKDLVNKGILLIKISTQEKHVSLNPRKHLEIIRMIEK